MKLCTLLQIMRFLQGEKRRTCRLFGQFCGYYRNYVKYMEISIVQFYRKEKITICNSCIVMNIYSFYLRNAPPDRTNPRAQNPILARWNRVFFNCAKTVYKKENIHKIRLKKIKIQRALRPFAAPFCPCASAKANAKANCMNNRKNVLWVRYIGYFAQFRE
mgnify:FL=1